jgi:peptidoglycan/xylan/chitin deacetylase (PgdA/CDA1 family)
MKKGKGTKIFLIGAIILLIAVIGYFGYRFYKKSVEKKEAEKIADIYFTDASDTQKIGKLNTDIEYKNNISYVIEYPIINNDQIDKQITDIINDLKNAFANEFNEEESTDLGISNLNYYQYIKYETYLGPDNTMSLTFIESATAGDTNSIYENVHTYNFSLNSGALLNENDIFKGDYKKALTTYLKNYLLNNADYKDSLLTDYENVISDNFHYAVSDNGLKIYFDKISILPKSFGVISVDIPYTDLKDNINLNLNNNVIVPTPNSGAGNETTNYTDKNANMYAKVMTSVYEQDNKTAKIIGEYNKADEVFVLAMGDNGWSKVKYNDGIGYVDSASLSEDVVDKANYKAVKETVYANVNVHIRAAASTTSESLAILNFQSSITRIGIGDNGWSKVTYKNKEAYIYTSCLTTTKPQNNNNNNIPNVNPQRGIDPNKPMVALTFDDGPNPHSTTRILDTLTKYNAVATFFDLGNLIYSYPKVVQREEATGSEVGTHTYTHSNLNKLSAAEIQNEIDRTDAAFMKVLGHKPTLMRPPYGNANATVRSTVPYYIINWDIDTLDWKSRNKDAILAEVHKYSNYDGRIILMHSIYGTTADAVEVLVPELISKGYQLVTVSELAKYKGVTLQTGKIYYHFR